MVRADILKDWIYGLEQEYNLALKQFWVDVKPDDKGSKTKELKGLAGELLKHSEIIGTKTVHVMYLSKAHRQLLIPGVVEKVEKYLSDKSGGYVELIFQVENDEGPLIRVEIEEEK